MNTVKANLDLNIIMRRSIERISLYMKMDINKLILFFMQAVFFNKKLQWVHNPYMTTILSSGMILPQRYVLDSFV